ncbi:hypothetical protein JR316_0011201 [Psilocybe cubensis]|uniref:Uncharacterized protein n=2 Tax=Psilocybe cubensis TaxID=181762 RepID=A0A8H7XVT3_PSICU|nr:hypothetical protein JR316_0011201 [Psilocybe cubensis]KAH9475646.1 hypothetical protein JR316_0011201 [Psilocybe cubensis]
MALRRTPPSLSLTCPPLPPWLYPLLGPRHSTVLLHLIVVVNNVEYHPLNDVLFDFELPNPIPILVWRRLVAENNCVVDEEHEHERDRER